MYFPCSRARARFAVTCGTFSLGAALSLALPDAAYAQASPEGSDDDSEIVVTGFRASVANAIEIKRSTNLIADIVSADDIAGLPDVSIAESLARLPGVSSQRTGGQASAINIRGLSQDLVSATLNGREQVATSGNRTIEFEQYPSELLSTAAVYKTPTASLVEGGIAGKVDLRTVRPLENSQAFTGQVNIRGIYNDRAKQSPDVSSQGYRASGSVQFKLADDTLGIALGYARLFQPNVATRFVQFDFPSPGNNGSPTRDLDGNGRPDSFNFGFEGIQFGGREIRDGAVGVIQWQPNDKLSVLIDSYYSRFKSNVKRRGFRVFALQSGDNSVQNPVVVNDALIGGLFTNQITTNAFKFGLGTELVNQDEGRKDELYTIGGNIGYEFSDRVKASFDVSYSRGTSFFNNSGVNLRPYAQTATGPRRADQIPGLISVNYQLNGLRLPTIRNISTNFTDTTATGGGFLLDGQFLVPQRDTDKLFAAAADFVIDTGEENFIERISFGGRYAKRDGDRIVTSFNTFNIPGAPLELPSSLVSLSGFRGAFANAGLPNFAVVDINGAFNLAFGNKLGVRQPTDQKAFPFTIDQSFQIDEETVAGYGQIDFSTTAGSLPFRGNVGVRIVHTDQSSTVLAIDPATTVDAIGNQIPGTRFVRTRGKTFTDFLPSANLILDLSSHDILRLSATRQISRPRFTDLRASISVNTGGDGNTKGDGGNPELDPFKANQFDLSYEHYFGQAGIFSAAAFYKDLRSFIINTTIANFNFVANGVTPPPIGGSVPLKPGNPVGSFSTPINGKGGYVYGFEFSFSKSFTELPSPFDGLGVILNYAYSRSNLNFPSSTSGRTINLPLPGLSKHVFSPTLYYEKAGFGARVSGRYRSSFVSPQIGISELILTSAPETVIDAQLSYEFPQESLLHGLKLLAQVNNLTDEPTRTYFGQQAQTGTIQKFGRTFLLGATFKF